MPNVVHTTPTKLRDALRHLDQLELPAEIRDLFTALVVKELGRCERTQARALAKAAAEGAAASDRAEGSSDADAVQEDGARLEAAQEGAAPACPESIAVVPDGSAPAETKPKDKGHGRNGAGAYVNAEHLHHDLQPDVIGALCEACGDNRPRGRRRTGLAPIARVCGCPIW